MNDELFEALKAGEPKHMVDLMTKWKAVADCSYLTTLGRYMAFEPLYKFMLKSLKQPSYEKFCKGFQEPPANEATRADFKLPTKYFEASFVECRIERLITSEKEELVNMTTDYDQKADTIDVLSQEIDKPVAIYQNNVYYAQKSHLNGLFPIINAKGVEIPLDSDYYPFFVHMDQFDQVTAGKTSVILCTKKRYSRVYIDIGGTSTEAGVEHGYNTSFLLPVVEGPSTPPNLFGLGSGDQVEVFDISDIKPTAVLALVNRAGLFGRCILKYGSTYTIGNFWQSAIATEDYDGLLEDRNSGGTYLRRTNIRLKRVSGGKWFIFEQYVVLNTDKWVLVLSPTHYIYYSIVDAQQVVVDHDKLVKVGTEGSTIPVNDAEYTPLEGDDLF